MEIQQLREAIEETDDPDKIARILKTGNVPDGVNVAIVWNSGETQTMLTRAVKKSEGRYKIFQYLLEHPDIDINLLDSDGFSALYHAVIWQRLDRLQKLLYHPQMQLDFALEIPHPIVVAKGDCLTLFLQCRT